MAPRNIIIDTDPGQDDAVAILLALASPEKVHVLGITAVAGNVPLDLTQKKCPHHLRISAKNRCARIRRRQTTAGTDTGYRRTCAWKNGVGWPHIARP